MCHGGMRGCSLSFQAKITGSDFTEASLCSVWSCLISKIAQCGLNTCRRWAIQSAWFPNFSSSFLWLLGVFLGGARRFCPKTQSGATKENNQILAVLCVFSVVDHQSPCWLSDALILPGLFETVTVYACDMMLFTPDNSRISPSFPLLLVRDLSSILRLISPDLSNLVLLYPISLITQTLAFPHLLYANGLSLLWWLST